MAGETLRHGLATDGPLVRALEGEDIACFSFAGRRMFILAHPDYVDHVLHAGVDRYHKSIEYELLRAVVGLSLFTDEDESWRRHRMMLNPMLAKRHVDELYRAGIGRRKQGERDARGEGRLRDGEVHDRAADRSAHRGCRKARHRRQERAPVRA